MSDFISFTIAGLSVAAILAVAASGLVLTYTTTGVFNFAHGAIGMLGAFTYWQLRFDWGWPTPIAVAVVLLIIGPLFGVFFEVAIFRGLQQTTETVKLVVSVSLLFAMIGIANWIWDPNEFRPDAKFFGLESFSIGDTVITYHELITIIGRDHRRDRFALPALPHARRHRDAGRRRRPAPGRVARSPARSLVDARVGDRMLARGAQRDPLRRHDRAQSGRTVSLLIVNAYAAAMIGRLRSLPLTFLGALLLGLLDGYLQGYLVVENNPYFDSTFVSAVPVIVLFIVLLVLPSARLRAVGIARTRELIPMPTMRGALTFAAVVVAGAALAIPLLTESNTVSMANLFGIGIVALSLVPLVGLAGQVSLMQWALAGIGAVTMAHLGAGGTPMGLVWAVVISAAVGALIALPTLRLSGIYLALATAAFAVFVERWLFVNLERRPVRYRIDHRRAAEPLRVQVRQPQRATHAARNRVRAAVHLRRVATTRSVRSTPARDEGQSRRVRNGRHEPHVHEAHRLRDLRGHCRPRRRAHRWPARQHQPAGLAVRGRASDLHGRRSSAASRASAGRCSPASAWQR